MERVYYIVLLAAPILWNWAKGRPVFGPITGLAGPFLVAMLLQLMFGRDFILGKEGMFWLLLFIYGFSLGYELIIHGQWYSVEITGNIAIRVRGQKTQYARLLAWSGCLVALLFVAVSLYFVRVLGYGVSDSGMFYREDFLRMAATGPMGLVYRAMQLFVFLSVIPMYLYVSSGARRSKYLAGAFILLVTAHAFVTVTKMGIMVDGLLWLGLWTSHRRTRIFDLNFRAIVWTLVGATLATTVMAAIMVVRYDLNSWQQDWFFRKMLVYAVGSPSAWSIDIAIGKAGQAGVPLGASLRGPLELVGAANRQVGAYTPVAIDAGFRGSVSNVYTGFKMLSSDLGLVGTACVMFALGVVFAKLERGYLACLSIGPLCLQGVGLLLLYWMSITLITYYNVFLFLVLESLLLGWVYEIEVAPINST